MRLRDIADDPRVKEAIPTAVGTAAPGVAPQQQQAAQPGQDPQTLQQTDPALAAQMAKDQQEKKQEITQQIRAKEQEIQELRKQLAQM